MDEWTARWETETLNRLNQSLSLIQGIWAVVLMVVAMGTAVAHAHLRVVQLEWRQEAERQTSGEWRQEMQTTLKEIDQNVRQIDVTVAELRARMTRQ